MSKNPLNQDELSRIVRTTQNIEGYSLASEDTVKKVKELKTKHGIKVSPRK